MSKRSHYAQGKREHALRGLVDRYGDKIPQAAVERSMGVVPIVDAYTHGVMETPQSPLLARALPKTLSDGGTNWANVQSILAGTENDLQRERVEELLGRAVSLGGASAPTEEWAPEMDGALHNEVAAMLKDPKLAAVQESTFHKVITAWRKRELMVPCMQTGEPLVTPENMHKISITLDELAKSSGVFLLQHDWSSAFQHATDFQGGEIELPYTLTVFECRVNGRRIALPIVSSHKGLPMLALPHYESERGWAWLGYADVNSDFTVDRTRNNTLFEGVDDLIDSLLKQVRAVLIALEAEVAVTEVIRAPYKLNQKREKAGKLPLFDFHVVSLAARKRYAPRLAEPGDQPTDHHHKRRLHFVRGHWRHYVNIKTYVKWHLRGDPELGFIDKEYRL